MAANLGIMEVLENMYQPTGTPDPRKYNFDEYTDLPLSIKVRAGSGKNLDSMIKDYRNGVYKSAARLAAASKEVSGDNQINPCSDHGSIN